MKNQKVLNIGLIIYAIYYIAMIVLVAFRNVPYGTGAVVTVVAMYLVALAALSVVVFQKRKWLSIASSVVFIGWLVFAFIQSTTSLNEDAVLLASIYTVLSLVALAFGWLRNKGK